MSVSYRSDKAGGNVESEAALGGQRPRSLACGVTFGEGPCVFSFPIHTVV